ncbi:DUF222 domain-containing protein (plasmid) [Coraliomargarita sp. W4R53]
MAFETSDEERAETALVSELVEKVVDVRQAIAELQAFEASVLAEAGRIGVNQSKRMTGRLSRDRDMPFRSITAEFATAMRIGDRVARAQIDDAMTLVDDYPETLAALQKGRISRSHVNAILKAGAPVSDPAARAQFDRDVVLVAEVETAGRMGPIAVGLAEQVQPRTLDERHFDARDERLVRVTPLTDGMAQLEAILPATLAKGIYDRLTQQAKAIRNARALAALGDAGLDAAELGAADLDAAELDAAELDAADLDAAPAPARDERTTDQIRADLLADMMLTSTPSADPTEGDEAGGLGAIRAIVQVTVPATTLCGTSSTPGDLAGFGPIDPETARRLAGAAAGWDRVFTHPITREVLAVDRYRPSDALKRHLRARDQHCRFPGCRMPVTRCDIDHTIDAAYGGPTEVNNLAHLCRGHHSLKHATPWKVVQHTGGILEWTSPTGRTYIDKPPGVAFAPSPPELDDHGLGPALDNDAKGFDDDDEPPWAHAAA